MAEKKTTEKKSTRAAPKKKTTRAKAAAKTKPKTTRKPRATKASEESTMPPPPKKSPFSDKELEYFEGLILERRKSALDDIESMRNQLSESSDQADGDSAFSFHMADAGTDAMEREKFYMLIERQQTYVGYLDRALDRIANRTYGVCKVTGKAISKERLEVVPHTEISIEAKKAQEVK